MVTIFVSTIVKDYGVFPVFRGGSFRGNRFDSGFGSVYSEVSMFSRSEPDKLEKKGNHIDTKVRKKRIKCTKTETTSKNIDVKHSHEVVVLNDTRESNSVSRR